MDVLAYFDSREHLPPQKRRLVLHRPHRHSAGQIHTMLTKTEPWRHRQQGCSLPEVTGVARKLTVLWGCMAKRRKTLQGSWSWNGCPHTGPGSRRKFGSGQVVLSTWDSSGSHRAADPEMHWCPLVPPLHSPSPELTPLKEQGGKSRLGHRNHKRSNTPAHLHQKLKTALFC